MFNLEINMQARNEVSLIFPFKSLDTFGSRSHGGFSILLVVLKSIFVVLEILCTFVYDFS